MTVVPLRSPPFQPDATDPFDFGRGAIFSTSLPRKVSDSLGEAFDAIAQQAETDIT